MRHVVGLLLLTSALGALLAGCAGAPAAEPTVGVRDIPGIGRVLVDMDGSTLYVSDEERAGTVRCTGACASVWPPLTVPRGSTLTPGEGLLGPLATVNRSDGRTQVTYDGRPLYLFALDTGPDMTKGSGRTDESGSSPLTWRVATPDGGRPASL